MDISIKVKQFLIAIIVLTACQPDRTPAPASILGEWETTNAWEDGVNEAPNGERYAGLVELSDTTEWEITWMEINKRVIKLNKGDYEQYDYQQWEDSGYFDFKYGRGSLEKRYILTITKEGSYGGLLYKYKLEKRSN